MKKKGDKGTPAISTASLPDIIFMLLFFFMVSTTMKEQELKVRFTLPDATELHKLEKKSLVSYIYFGTPLPMYTGKLGTGSRIQLNDAFSSTKNILEFIASERDKLSEGDRAAMTVCLKADGGTKMGIVTDIKEELKRANSLKISYAGKKVPFYGFK